MVLALPVRPFNLLGAWIRTLCRVLLCLCRFQSTVAVAGPCPITPRLRRCPKISDTTTAGLEQTAPSSAIHALCSTPRHNERLLLPSEL